MFSIDAKLLAALAGGFAYAQTRDLEITKGPFQGSRESLKAYRTPDWFRDAKFGIWAHWGPQSAPEDGDWYARNMYMEGSPQYKFHVEHYGHPSKVGFKDVITTFKADKWDPEHLGDGSIRESGGEILREHGRPSRQFRHVEFAISNAMERREGAGPKKDIVGMLEAGGAQTGVAFWRERASLQQLRLAGAVPSER